jgi:hypothetical protein
MTVLEVVLRLAIVVAARCTPVDFMGGLSSSRMA